MNGQGNAYHTYTDQELLDNYRDSHNNEWLGILLTRYLHLILGVCMKYLGNEEDAKEHAQQVCFQVLKSISRHQVTYFKSWLYQVAKNHCLMHLRKTKNVHIQPFSEHEAMNMFTEIIAIEPGEEDVQLSYLHQAMEELGDAQRQCLYLFFFEKKSYQDISSETGFSTKQVKSHIQNGKRNLKQIMERIADEEANKQNNF